MTLWCLAMHYALSVLSDKVQLLRLIVAKTDPDQASLHGNCLCAHVCQLASPAAVPPGIALAGAHPACSALSGQACNTPQETSLSAHTTRSHPAAVTSTIMGAASCMHVPGLLFYDVPTNKGCICPNTITG